MSDPTASEDVRPTPSASATDAADDASRPSLSAVETARKLLDDAQTAVRSEFALWSICAAIVSREARAISVWGIVALMAIFVAILVLAIGMMLALTPFTGALGAALIVPAVLLVIAGLAGLRIRHSLAVIRKAVETVQS